MRDLILASFILCTLGAGVAEADDPKFDFAKPEPTPDEPATPDVEWNANAEAGAIFTTGNSQTTTMTAAFKTSRKAAMNKLALEASAAYARSAIRTLVDQNGNGLVDNEAEIDSVKTTTAETLGSKVRYDRFLTQHNSLFVAVLGSRDLPAGKELVLGAQVGYSRLLYKSTKTEVSSEIGYDFSREQLTVGDPVAIHSARAFAGAKSTMSEGVDAEGSIELLSNLSEETLPTGKDGSAFKDTRVNAHVALSAKVGKDLAVQTAFDVKYDNRPGPLAIKDLAPGFVPEATKLDTILKASLIYTFD